MELVTLELDACEFFLANFDFGFVLISVDGRFDNKACASRGFSDQINDRLMTH